MTTHVLARVRSGEEERVTPLELFFDLVFVFAITQVTALVADDPTWAGLARGVLVLGVLWWAWAAYAWLTNTLNPDEGVVRIAMFAAMAAMLIVSLAVPEAFDDVPVFEPKTRTYTPEDVPAQAEARARTAVPPSRPEDREVLAETMAAMAQLLAAAAEHLRRP